MPKANPSPSSAQPNDTRHKQYWANDADALRATKPRHCRAAWVRQDSAAHGRPREERIDMWTRLRIATVHKVNRRNRRKRPPPVVDTR
jgi:hypothetical protein